MDADGAAGFAALEEGLARHASGLEVAPELHRHRLYAASDVIALYHERWEIELAYDEVRTHQLDRLETIRSRSVKGVEQEMWGILLTFNLVRLEMRRSPRKPACRPRA